MTDSVIVVVKPGAVSVPVYDDQALYRTEHFKRCSFPCCCITLGSDVTTVKKTELAVRRNDACCQTGLCCGSGYILDRFDPYKVVGFDTDVSVSCCCIACKASQTTTSTSGSVQSNIDRGSASKFNEAMTWMANRARGYDDPVLGRSFQFSYRCGMSLRVLKIHENGFITAEDNQGDCCSCSKRVLTKAAFLENVSYIKYTRASLLGCLLCCAQTGIEISFDGDVYTIDGEVNEGDLAELYRALLTTMRKGPPLAHMQKFDGAFGNALTVAPDFVTMTYRPWYACVCPCVASTSVVTVRTKDVAYVKASMLTFSKACTAAWEETSEPWFEMKKAAHRVCHEDLAEFFSWPCSCFRDMLLASNLLVQTIFICIIFPLYSCFGCCFRRSGVVVGAPGPKPRMAFPGLYEPETFVGDVASTIEKAQDAFEWPPVAHAVRQGGAQRSRAMLEVRVVPSASESSEDPGHNVRGAAKGVD